MKKNHQKWRILFRLDFLSILEQNPPLLVLFFSKSSTFGYENLKNLHFGSFFFFFIRFFVKTWKTSTFGGFLLKSEDFVQNRLPILHFWWFFFLQNPPLLVTKTWKTVFFSSKLENPLLLLTKTWKTSTFGVFFVSKWIFLQNLHF